MKYSSSLQLNIMKNLFLINPIPKQFVITIKYIMVTFISVVNFSIDLKAIPEDWPSTTGNEFVIPGQSESLQLTCRGSIQISLDSSGNGIVTPAMLLVGTFVNYNNFKVVIW